MILGNVVNLSLGIPLILWVAGWAALVSLPVMAIGIWRLVDQFFISKSEPKNGVYSGFAVFGIGGSMAAAAAGVYYFVILSNI